MEVDYSLTDLKNKKNLKIFLKKTTFNWNSIFSDHFPMKPELVF